QFGMKFEDDSLFSSDLFLVIRVDQKREGRSIRSGRRLDDIGNDLLFALFVEIFQRLSAELRVLFKIKVSAVCDPFDLAPSHRKKVLDIGGPFGVVRQFVFLMLAETN